MSFSFGFSQADVSDDELEPLPVDSKPSAAASTAAPSEVPPKLHSIKSILDTLINVRITFDNYTTPGGNIVYRRELFDMKHQCMMEEDNDSEANKIHKILLGSDEELDLQKNVYEGGFKSWECSYDLVDEIANQENDQLFSNKSSILELGCGSALPSCFILMKWFEKKVSNKTLLLSDFNLEVLRLVTVPNLIVHWASTLEPQELAKLQDPDIPMKNDELQVTAQLIEAFTDSLHQQNLDIQCISGSWSSAFADLVQPFNPDFILSSETIYSLDTLPTFITLLVDLMTKRSSVALIAAKSYYFGVGGSLKEFTSRLAPPLAFETNDVPNSSLKRAIVKITT
ncbi:hypothetical protein FT663_01692 [Candidozyma haemuli var. vulneris]|nr:hypothetical protein FT662_04253 [[Candida] haemuloni var. vulneris]KAF3993792.1 hypothetical protein FT663_01692 [[Candida] haemuloni var. vulneris]